MLFNQVTLIGAGLMGGSLGLAIQKHGLAKRVVVYVRRAGSVNDALALKIAHAATQDLAEAVKEADLVVLTTPIAQMRPLAEVMLSAMKAGAIVTDVGSVKAPVVEGLEPLFAARGIHFVGSHPMAGGEKVGMAHARDDLFESAVSVITPTSLTSRDALQRVDQFWRGIGGATLQMSPERHDDLVSRSSHLPHVVAAELASYVLSPAHPKEQGRLCAGGFRDTTRIASGSPEMWRDICLANQKNLGRVLGVFIESLQEFQHTLASGDATAIEEFFQKAKERRDEWSQG
ncbi:MAG: prephenate dehydrogenase/arogenate dehydrogenase family protein [Verrucomicrobia bacterium]|nr:prephenate dehydrogenase/arogenate dehydrogenase family protein [Verrucomicrobiota bacterium]MBI3866985.1 prephenate dehydrogenase/arogenate dehydrogenase family protein [Verrucomicrobiota bacterium]